MFNRLRLLSNKKSRSNICLKAKQSTEASIKLKAQYAVHNFNETPSDTVTLKKEDGITYFKNMDIIRRFENSCAQMYREKVIRGFCHLYAGQEAVGVGILAALGPEDVLITAYRAHGLAYLMGATVEEVLCELTGRHSGIAKGKGGSMHMYTSRMFGGNGIVGSHVPVGAGLGFALKYLGKQAVSITMYGDGASNQGQVYESFNLAKILNIPVIFLIENNKYGLGTAATRASANTKFYTRCEYIPGLFIDGMDILAVREGMRVARNYALKNGPMIVEALTYRYFGHSMSDPGTSYRKREEIEETREKRDCIKKFKQYLIDNKLCTDEEIKAIEKENKQKVDKATALARSDKFPPPSELYTDIYVKSLEQIRDVLPFKPLPHLNSKK